MPAICRELWGSTPKEGPGGLSLATVCMTAQLAPVRPTSTPSQPPAEPRSLTQIHIHKHTASMCPAPQRFCAGHMRQGATKKQTELPPPLLSILAHASRATKERRWSIQAPLPAMAQPPPSCATLLRHSLRTGWPANYPGALHLPTHPTKPHLHPCLPINLHGPRRACTPVCLPTLIPPRPTCTPVCTMVTPRMALLPATLVMRRSPKKMDTVRPPSRTVLACRRGGAQSGER